MIRYLIYIISAVITGPWLFFWIAVSVADVAAGNPIDSITFLAKNMSTILLNGKPAFIKGPRTWPRNPSFWFIGLLVLLFNKIPLLSKDFINSVISFILLSDSVIP